MVRDHLTIIEVWNDFVYNVCVCQGCFFFLLQYLLEESFFFQMRATEYSYKVSLKVIDIYLPIQAKVMPYDNSN